MVRIHVGAPTQNNLPCGRFFGWCEAQRCFALAKPRAGVASEFAVEQIRLVTTGTSDGEQNIPDHKVINTLPNNLLEFFKIGV